MPLDQEVTDEIALHLELRTRELIERGMDPGSAREPARSSGWATSPPSSKPASTLEGSEIETMRLGQWIEEGRHDVRFALRQLRRGARVRG